MNSQYKIFAYLLFFISLDMHLVNADFINDRTKLGECFARYMQKLVGWSRFKYADHVNPANTYIVAYQGNNVTGLASFESITKASFELIVFIDTRDDRSSINFEDNPQAKMDAIIQLCTDIKNTCPDQYHPPNIPLVDYLEDLYVKSSGGGTTQFDQNCKN